MNQVEQVFSPSPGDFEDDYAEAGSLANIFPTLNELEHLIEEATSHENLTVLDFSLMERLKVKVNRFDHKVDSAEMRLIEDSMCLQEYRIMRDLYPNEATILPEGLYKHLTNPEINLCVTDHMNETAGLIEDWVRESPEENLKPRSYSTETI